MATLTISCNADEISILVPVDVARSFISNYSGNFPEITLTALNELIEKTSTRLCMDRLCKLVASREYSSADLKAKLETYGYSADIAAHCIARAIDIKLVDDIRYVSLFVRSKVAAGWGRVRIERELSRHGIDLTSLLGWPHDFFADEDQEIDRARFVLAKRSIPEKNAYQKLMRYLIGKGFSYDISAQAIKEKINAGSQDDFF